MNYNDSDVLDIKQTYSWLFLDFGMRKNSTRLNKSGSIW